MSGSYDIVQTTPQADAAVMNSVQRANVGTFNAQPNAFFNKLNFLTQTTMAVPYEIQRQTGNTDATTIISALVNGVDQGAASVNAQAPYGYGAMSQYPGSYAYPGASPYYGSGYGMGSYNPGYSYDSVSPYSSPITSSSNLTSGEASGAQTTSSNLTGGLPTSTYYGGGYGATTGMSNLSGGGLSTGTGMGSDQIMQQVSAMSQNQMQLMQVQFVVGQEATRSTALTNVISTRISAERNVANNLRVG